MNIFAACHPHLKSLEDAAAAILSALGLPSHIERQSSNWIEGRYILGQADDGEVKVSIGDTDHDDRPIGIFISGLGSERLANLCVERLEPLGFAISQLHGWGRHDERRVDL